MPGSTVTSHAKLAHGSGLTEKQVRRALGNLVDTGEVSVGRAGNGQLVTLRNWAKYQSEEDYRADAGQAKGSNGAAKGQRKGSERATIEEGKKGGNEEGKNKVEPTMFPIVWPTWAGEKTTKAWEAFKIYRQVEHKASYKSSDTEQKAVNILASYFKSDSVCAAALEHSTGKNWRFPVDPAEYSYPKPEGVAQDQPVWNPRA